MNEQLQREREREREREKEREQQDISVTDCGLFEFYARDKPVFDTSSTVGGRCSQTVQYTFSPKTESYLRRCA
jgi:hypothetical protein